VEAIGQKVQEMLAQMSKDPTIQSKVKEYETAVSEMLKVVQQLAQNIAQMQAAKGQGQDQQMPDPKDAAKVQAMLLQAQTKAQISDRASQQKTRQREETWATKQAQSEVSHNERLQQEKEKHSLNLEKSIAELEAELTAKKMELSHGMTIQQMQAPLQEGT
jgi:hypothetical protein